MESICGWLCLALDKTGTKLAANKGVYAAQDNINTYLGRPLVSCMTYRLSDSFKQIRAQMISEHNSNTQGFNANRKEV